MYDINAKACDAWFHCDRFLFKLKFIKNLAADEKNALNPLLEAGFGHLLTWKQKSPTNVEIQNVLIVYQWVVKLIKLRAKSFPSI
jgi:hypothetical protein